ncbi:hypothetical protein KXW39_006025 [Aspergillus fumigatus]|nr:hypothetical protein KXX17_008796 [Aspergillus fumigatus]KAH1760288.1 hypothetical protein KXX56_004028 [Aspergillus fumigatus]KAH1913375.1 hypothetical protein KXW69_007457 [Aspergillus fumigatus]KAH2077432.1 hypothetical protein KXW32_008630 [Aspergillus fumigatus]KAH2541959.1 hypothetical protein KXW12_008239 [Aspergillus fumigatus]
MPGRAVPSSGWSEAIMAPTVLEQEIIPVMADVAQDAQALHLAMRIPKTASPMISARILTMPVEGQVIPTAELLMMLQWMIFFLVSQMDVRRQIQLSF